MSHSASGSGGGSAGGSDTVGYTYGRRFDAPGVEIRHATTAGSTDRGPRRQGPDYGPYSSQRFHPVRPVPRRVATTGGQ